MTLTDVSIVYYRGESNVNSAPTRLGGKIFHWHFTVDISMPYPRIDVDSSLASGVLHDVSASRRIRLRHEKICSHNVKYFIQAREKISRNCSNVLCA